MVLLFQASSPGSLPLGAFTSSSAPSPSPPGPPPSSLTHFSPLLLGEGNAQPAALILAASPSIPWGRALDGASRLSRPGPRDWHTASSVWQPPCPLLGQTVLDSCPCPGPWEALPGHGSGFPPAPGSNGYKRSLPPLPPCGALPGGATGQGSTSLVSTHPSPPSLLENLELRLSYVCY